MFHLDVSKVDLVLHMLQWLYLHCFKCFTCVQTYVVNVLSEWFKSRSCVADHCPPAAACAPSWFTCWSLRPADASSVHPQAAWVGRGHGYAGWTWGHGSTVLGTGRGSGLWCWLGTGRNAPDAMRARDTGAVSGRGPRTGRPDTSPTHKLILFLIKATSTI